MPPLKNFYTANRKLPNGGGNYPAPIVQTKSPLFPQAYWGGESSTVPVYANAGATTKPIITPPTQPVFTGSSGAVTPVSSPSPISVERAKSPEEIAAAMKKTMLAGDIANYSYWAMNNPDASTMETANIARRLQNAQGDIGSGTTDPYGVASKSKWAFNASELAAIEKAGAGVYDPAITSAITKLELKQKEEDRAEQFKYDLALKMAGGGGLEGPASYQEWTLAGGKKGTGMTYAEYLKGIPEGSSYKSEIAVTGRQAVDNMLKIAEASPGIFGATAAMSIPTSFRSDAFRNYSAQLDSLKGNIIPAALTAMREASKTGGALGQVSDREGAWLGASLGALDMAQSSDQVISQLKQIDEHLAVWQDAVNKYSTPGVGSVLTVTDPDGGVHTFSTQAQADAFRQAIGQ